MKNPFRMHRQGRGPVLELYRAPGRDTESGWLFSRSSAKDGAVSWLLSGGIRGCCAAIGWYRW